MNYISASDMRFKQAKSKEHRATTFTPSLTLPPRGGGWGEGGSCSVFLITGSLILLLLFAFCPLLSAEIRDRVVAFVDTRAITLSDLKMKLSESRKVKADIRKEEVLNTMINRVLLLREAKKIRLEAPSEEELIKEYIDMKIKALIRVKEEEIHDFYGKHIEDFEGKELEDVRDEIENFLIEHDLNERLKSHINELKEKTCVRIQLNPE